MRQTTAVPAVSRRTRKWNARNARANLTGWLFVSPWVISLLVFMAYPMLSSFYFAGTHYTILKPPVWTGFQNIRVMFTKDPLFWKAVYN